MRMDRLLTILCLLVSTGLSAQLYTTADIYIGEGAELYSSSYVENDGGVENEGDFYVTGNWESEGVYYGSGSVYFIGELDQTVYHNSGDFTKLVVAGGGDKYLDSSLKISSELELNSGDLITKDTFAVVLEDGANVSNASEESYVQGRMVVASSNELFFPVGLASGYFPVEFQNYNGSVSFVSCNVSKIENLDVILTSQAGNVVGNVFWVLDWDQQQAFEANAVVPNGAGEADECADLAIGQAESMGDSLYTAGSGTLNADNFFADCYISSSMPVTGKIIVPINEQKQFFIPNALSPHATNPESQTVKIYGGEVVSADFSFVVTNAWGETVFETESFDDMVNEGWKGTSQITNELVEPGQYFYILKYNNEENEESVSGSIWMIR